MSEVTLPAAQRAPEAESVSPGRWVRENLFSSVSNVIQSVFFSLVLLGLLRWVLGQIFSEEANWTSVATNMRLLFTYNYPTEQFVRIWFAAGALFLAVGASFAAWNLNPMVTVRRIGVAVVGTGALCLVVDSHSPDTTPSAVRIRFPRSSASGWSLGRSGGARGRSRAASASVPFIGARRRRGARLRSAVVLPLW